jgi:hypothetical protein
MAVILERALHRSAVVIGRMPSCSAMRALAVALIAVVFCIVLSACSPGTDYPSLFPAVHDIPPPRSETPLDPNQVQQATEDLISARDRAEAQTSQNKKATSPSASATDAAGARKPPIALSPANAASRHTSGSESAQDAGTQTK